ncbi:hypothetical protein ACOSQ2_023171 [Xanthoceras sorbifolium]
MTVPKSSALNRRQIDELSYSSRVMRECRKGPIVDFEAISTRINRKLVKVSKSVPPISFIPPPVEAT